MTVYYDFKIHTDWLIRLGLITSLILTETCITWQRSITRSCSLGDTLTRSATFHALTQTTDHQEEEGSLQRRKTVGESGNIILWTNKFVLHNSTVPTDMSLKNNTTLCFWMPFMQHHICLSLRIRMETSLRRYCKPSKQGLQGGISTQPRAAAITEYALFIFPCSLDLSKQWLCK